MTAKLSKAYVPATLSKTQTVWNGLNHTYNIHFISMACMQLLIHLELMCKEAFPNSYNWIVWKGLNNRNNIIMESHNFYGLNAIAYWFGAHVLANSLKIWNGWIVEMIYNNIYSSCTIIYWFGADVYANLLIIKQLKIRNSLNHRDNIIMELHNLYGLNAIAYWFGSYMLANSLKIRNGWIIEMIYQNIYSLSTIS